MSQVKPFQLTVAGNATIPHPAERALIHVTVASEGLNKAAVSDEVITATKHIETLLSEYSPKDTSLEAKAAAPLAHWNKTSLSSTSWIPYSHKEDSELSRHYKASVNFDIRFKEFKALGKFGTKISSLSHVEVSNISWILTADTEKSFKGKLRRDAAADAMRKARDYCEVLGCTNIRPVELEQGDSFTRQLGSRMNNSKMQMQMAQQVPGMLGRTNGGGSVDEKTEDLEFRPQEVRMSHEVTIKFHANPPSSGIPAVGSPARRSRSDDYDDDMEALSEK